MQTRLIPITLILFVTFGCAMARTASSWFPAQTPSPVAGGQAKLETPTSVPPTSTPVPTPTPTVTPVPVPLAPPGPGDSLSAQARGQAALASSTGTSEAKIRAESADTVVRLSWAAVPGATGYAIYRDDGGVPGELQ